MTYRKLVYKDPTASERNKAETKKGVENIIKKAKDGTKVIDSYIMKYYINRLDAKMLLLKGLRLEIKGAGESNTESLDDVFLCTETGKKELEETKNKAEETKDSSK